MKNLFLILFLTFSTFTLSAQTAAVSDSAKPNLEDYVGKYTFSEFFKQGTIEIKNGELFAELDEYGSNKILKQTEKDTFKSTSSYGTIYTFKRNDQGKIIGVKLELMGQEVTGEKE
jgi:Domain of unknown function (DUF3471)